jgi:integrase
LDPRIESHKTMPRQVRDASLETRTARSRLKAQHKCYYRLIEPGLHLGYRKPLAGPGAWVVRRYKGDGEYAVENLRTPHGAFVLADDFADPDGVAVLSFAQAQQQVVRAKRAKSEPVVGPYTVADAMEDYFRFLAGDGRAKHSIYDAERRAQAFILPPLGGVKLSALTTDRLRRWRDDLVQAAPRVRTREGEPQKYREAARTDDEKRARRASANRAWSILRSGLNHAFREGKVETDLPWRKIKPFRAVDAARVGYLSIEGAKRFINACDPEFRPLVRGALQTGARYGELCALTVADFNPDVGAVAIRKSKSGKPRHIALTDEGRAFFERLRAGRTGAEPMFGRQWGMSHQLRPMAEAVERAKIERISFHGLRHTWASHAVMNGVPLLVVAKNLGHRDSRMVEKHYGHLAPSYVADAIRAGAPRFESIEPDAVVPISAGRTRRR